MAQILFFDCISQRVYETTYDRKKVKMDDSSIARAYSLCVDFRDINFASELFKRSPTELHIEKFSTYVVISNNKTSKHGVIFARKKIHGEYVLVFKYEKDMSPLPIYPIDLCKIINNVLVTKVPCYPCMKTTHLRAENITYNWW